MAATLEKPSAKKYYADKLRQEHPELKDASDDEVLSVVKKVEIPEATPEEFETVLRNIHGEPPKEESFLGKQIGRAHV